jgi:hypothetical protein
MGRSAAYSIALLLTAAASGASTAQTLSPSQAAALSLPLPRANAECADLPGGNAPINKIAALTTPLSPRSLDLTYYRKRLADLTDEDFVRIHELSVKCGRTLSAAARGLTGRLREVVREAQEIRQGTLQWVDDTKVAAVSVPMGRERLIQLNQIWGDLSERANDMTRSDLRSFADWIILKTQEVYNAAPGFGPRPPIETNPQAAAVLSLATAPRDVPEIRSTGAVFAVTSATGAALRREEQ